MEGEENVADEDTNADVETVSPDEVSVGPDPRMVGTPSLPISNPVGVKINPVGERRDFQPSETWRALAGLPGLMDTKKRGFNGYVALAGLVFIFH
jgi:hypothetical protein